MSWILSIMMKAWLLCSLLAPSMARAQVASNEVLTQLRERYSGFPTLISQFHWTSPDTKKQHIGRFVVGSDGRYMEMHWVEALSPPGMNWKQTPVHASAFDGASFLAIEPGSQEYTVVAESGEVHKSPGFMQWSAAPAPVVPILIDYLLATSDVVIGTDATGDERITRASSASAGLQMSWDDRWQVRSVIRGSADSDSVEHHYSKFITVQAGRPDVATHRLERVIVMKDGNRTVIRETDLDFDVSVSPKPEEDILFRPAKFGLNRYDKPSGNVYRSDGSVLYNRKRLEAMLDESSWWKTLRPWAMAVLGVGVFVGGVLTVRRMRRA